LSWYNRNAAGTIYPHYLALLNVVPFFSQGDGLKSTGLGFASTAEDLPSAQRYQKLQTDTLPIGFKA
jgi:hypothetical protein